jgi:hypothetical protein
MNKRTNLKFKNKTMHAFSILSVNKTSILSSVLIECTCLWFPPAVFVVVFILSDLHKFSGWISYIDNSFNIKD